MAAKEGNNRQTEEIRIRLGSETTFSGVIEGPQTAAAYECAIKYFESVRDQFRAAEKASHGNVKDWKDIPQPVAKAG